MDNRIGSENNGKSECLACSSLDTKVLIFNWFNVAIIYFIN